MVATAAGVAAAAAAGRGGGGGAAAPAAVLTLPFDLSLSFFAAVEGCDAEAVAVDELLPFDAGALTAFDGDLLLGRLEEADESSAAADAAAALAFLLVLGPPPDDEEGLLFESLPLELF